MFTRKIFSKNYISEKYFWAPGERQGVLRGKCLREKLSPECFGKLFPFVLWPNRGIYRYLGAPGERQGVLRGKNFTRKFFSKNYIPEMYFSGKLVSARVVARQGYLGIFGGPRGTLGGTEGKNFYAKNFLQKLHIRKVFFGNFWETFSSFVLWPDRGIQGSLGAPGGRQGVLRGKIFTRKIFSKNYISEKYVSGIFRKTFSARVVARQGYLGIFGGPWGRQGVLRGKMFTRKIFSKNYISEKYFSEIFGTTFSARVVARQGYLGIFGGPWGTLGGTEGKNFTRKIFSKNYISEKYFSKTTFSVSCCGPIGVFIDLWGPLGNARGY